MGYGQLQSMRFSDRNLGRTSKGEGESSVDLEVTLPFGLCGKHVYRSRTKLITRLAI